MATKKFDNFYQQVFKDMFFFGGHADVTETEDGKVNVTITMDDDKVKFPTQGKEFRAFLSHFKEGMMDVKEKFGKKLTYENAFLNAVDATSKLADDKCTWNAFLNNYARNLEKEY